MRQAISLPLPPKPTKACQGSNWENLPSPAAEGGAASRRILERGFQGIASKKSPQVFEQMCWDALNHASNHLRDFPHNFLKAETSGSMRR